MNRYALPVILLAGIAIRLALVFAMPLYPDTTPIPGYNDEPLHLEYVRFLADFSIWPIWQPADSTNQLTGEFTQPPLYYALAAQGYRLGEAVTEGGGLIGARIISLILGLVAALFAYRAVQLLLNRDGSPAASAVALGALTAMLLAPTTVLFTSLVTNDALILCLGAMAFYSLILCRLGRGGAGRQILTGLILGAAVWGKMSGLTLFPLIWFTAPEGSTGKVKWSARGRVAAVAVATIMPLIAWNLAQYGQFLPITPGYAPEQALGVSGGGLLHPVMAVKLWLRTAAMPFDQVWGSLVEKLISLVWVIIWGGLTIWGGYQLIRTDRRSLLLTAAVGWVLLGFAFHNLKLFQVEFRLLIPAFPALAAMAGAGAAAARLPWWTQAALWATPLVMLVGNH